MELNSEHYPEHMTRHNLESSFPNLVLQGIELGTSSYSAHSAIGHKGRQKSYKLISFQ